MSIVLSRRMTKWNGDVWSAQTRNKKRLKKTSVNEHFSDTNFYKISTCKQTNRHRHRNFGNFPFSFISIFQRKRKRKTFRHPILRYSNRRSSRFFFRFLSFFADNKNRWMKFCERKFERAHTPKVKGADWKSQFRTQVGFSHVCVFHGRSPTKHQHYSGARHIYAVPVAKNRTKTNARSPKHLQPTRLHTTHQQL